MALTIVKRPTDAPGAPDVPKWYVHHLSGRPGGLTIGVSSHGEGSSGHLSVVGGEDVDKPNVCGLVWRVGGDRLGGSWEENRFIYMVD